MFVEFTLMKDYMNDIYKHDVIAEVDMEIKRNFGTPTKATVNEFVNQFSNTNSAVYKKIIELIINSGFFNQNDL